MIMYLSSGNAEEEEETKYLFPSVYVSIRMSVCLCISVLIIWFDASFLLFTLLVVLFGWLVGWVGLLLGCWFFFLLL